MQATVGDQLRLAYAGLPRRPTCEHLPSSAQTPVAPRAYMMCREGRKRPDGGQALTDRHQVGVGAGPKASRPSTGEDSSLHRNRGYAGVGAGASPGPSEPATAQDSRLVRPACAGAVDGGQRLVRPACAGAVDDGKGSYDRPRGNMYTFTNTTCTRTHTCRTCGASRRRP